MGRPLPVLVLVLAACGPAHVPRAPRMPAATRAPDPAVELALRLPGGARMCVVTRPGAASVPERRGIRWVSRAVPFAWVGGLDVVSYAAATQLGDEGERSDVILLRLRDPAPRVRAALDANPWMRLTWEGDATPCEDLDCTRTTVRARFEDDGTVRITRGTWRSARRTSVDGRCAALLRTTDATEVSAFDHPYDRLGPHWESREVRVARGGVDVVTRLELPTVAASLGVAEMLRGATIDGAARVVSRTLEGTAIVTKARAEGDDLQLAAGDDDRLAAALAHEASLEAPQPVDRVDVRDAGVVASQLDVRRTALVGLRGAARVEAVRGLVALLVRVHAARPDDPSPVRQLARLYLDELHEPASAARLAAEMRELAPEEPAWSALAREALAAAGDADGLAAALGRDGVVRDARVARRAAEDVIAARAVGATAAWAEGALRVDALLDAARPPASTALARPVDLSLAGLPATLLAVLRLGAADRFAPRAVYLRVEGNVRTAPGPTEALAAPPVVVRDARGRARLVLAARADEAAASLRRLGDVLASRIGDGPATVRIALVSSVPGAPERAEVQLEVTGTVTGGVLRASRVSRTASGLDWDVVARVLCSPLGLMPPRAMPPPDVPLEARSAEEAERLADHAEPDVHCSRDGAHLECRPIVGGPDDLSRVLFALADELLGDAPRSLWPLPRGRRAQ